MIQPLTKALYLALALALTVALGFASEQTWTGKISDDKCCENHRVDAKHTKEMRERDCALDCIEAGGKYVFIRKGKVYKIANQNFSELPRTVGYAVKLTGEMNDDTLTVSNISRR